MDLANLQQFLECSVCLEQLTETSRVLPCQHTFCCGCLENIASKGHARCPECRAEFTGTPVKNLPKNVLLMRILGGMKQEKHPKESAKADNAKSNNKDSANASQAAAVRKVLDCLPHAKALFDFAGRQPGDVSFLSGDVIYLLQRLPGNHWYDGLVKGTRGSAPANYLEVVVPLPDFEAANERAPYAKALYDFDDPSDEVLSFKQGDMICFVKRVQGDSNWGEGLLGDQYGIFPFNYVELNSAAKSLLSSSTVVEDEDDSVGDEQVSDGKTASPWVKLETAKRHTIHVENPNEHEASIRQLTPFATDGEHFQSNSESRRASGSLLEGSTAEYGQLRQPTTRQAARPERRLLSTAASDNASRGGACAKDDNELCVALYNYTPQNEDELLLALGKMYKIVHRYEDGWVKGADAQTGKCGMFPANYIKSVMSVCNVGRARSGSEPCESSTPSGDSATARANLMRVFKKKPKRPAPVPPPPYSAVSTTRASSGVSSLNRPMHPLRPSPDEPPPPYSAEEPMPRAVGARQPPSSSNPKERCRVIADYPPTENDELELKVGDIVVVKKKSSDGWYKGTCLRNGRTGLFPSSFVELMTR